MRLRIYATIWLLVAIAAAALLSSNLRMYATLADSGVKSQGIIIRTEPMNHELVFYSYQVGGVSYQGADNVGLGNTNFAGLSLGEFLMIYYLPSNPRISILGEPAAKLKNEIIFVSMVTLFAPTFIVCIFAISRKQLLDRIYDY